MKSLVEKQIKLNAYDSMNDFKNCDISRKETVDAIHDIYNVPFGTLYDWYSGSTIFGRKGTMHYIPELFYVIGALLGDGCIYNWKVTSHYVILVGDKHFTKKYASMLSKCVDKKIKNYIDRNHNAWFVRCNNNKLYDLFHKARTDDIYLRQILAECGRISRLLFVEGFFDAEGCVKIIKEPVRVTPKICLDICNTNKGFLDVIQQILLEDLHIEARYSIQNPNPAWKGKNKLVAYHLRIYKKEFVRRFFENISTTKLKREKKIYVYNWLNRERLILERKSV